MSYVTPPRTIIALLTPLFMVSYFLKRFSKSLTMNQYDYLHALLTALKFPDAEIDWDALLPWKITLP